MDVPLLGSGFEVDLSLLALFSLFSPVSNCRQNTKSARAPFLLLDGGPHGQRRSQRGARGGLLAPLAHVATARRGRALAVGDGVRAAVPPLARWLAFLPSAKKNTTPPPLSSDSRSSVPLLAGFALAGLRVRVCMRERERDSQK